MSRIVLDASAVMAVLNREPGSEKLSDELLSNSVASTVNLAEVQTKLVGLGADPDRCWKDAMTVVGEAVAFTSDQAKAAGDMVQLTRSAGLSLGDRACLALARELNAPVYTTDRAWRALKVGVRVHLLR
ncbi:MAG TPA: type II toxin-antitoxin system VapC family toxin [Acidisarcina sp.]